MSEQRSRHDADPPHQVPGASPGRGRGGVRTQGLGTRQGRFRTLSLTFLLKWGEFVGGIWG